MSSFFRTGILILSREFIYLWNTVLDTQFLIPQEKKKKNQLVKHPYIAWILRLNNSGTRRALLGGRF